MGEQGAVNHPPRQASNPPPPSRKPGISRLFSLPAAPAPPREPSEGAFGAALLRPLLPSPAPGEAGPARGPAARTAARARREPCGSPSQSLAPTRLCRGRGAPGVACRRCGAPALLVCAAPAPSCSRDPPVHPREGRGMCHGTAAGRVRTRRCAGHGSRWPHGGTKARSGSPNAASARRGKLEQPRAQQGWAPPPNAGRGSRFSPQRPAGPSRSSPWPLPSPAQISPRLHIFHRRRSWKTPSVPRAGAVGAFLLHAALLLLTGTLGLLQGAEPGGASQYAPATPSPCS